MTFPNNDIPLAERGFQTIQEQIKILEELIKSTAERAIRQAALYPDNAKQIADKAKEDIAAYQSQIDALTNQSQD